MSLHPSTWRNARTAFTGAVMLGLASLPSFPAAAQQVGTPFTDQQCSQALKIIDAIRTEYKGRLSADFLTGLVKFGESKCDTKTPITRVDGFADEAAYKAIRVRLVALRTAANGAPAVASR